MLRYLQAFALLQETRMDVEAAGHIRAASAKPFAPPFLLRQRAPLQEDAPGAVEDEDALLEQIPEPVANAHARMKADSSAMAEPRLWQ